MFVDTPPATFARFITHEYVDAYVGEQYCGASQNVAPGFHRIDIAADCGYIGAMVEFRNSEGAVVAFLPWENWKLTIIE